MSDLDERLLAIFSTPGMTRRDALRAVWDAGVASRAPVEGGGPPMGGIPDLTEAEATAFQEALRDPVEGEREVTREELIEFLHPLNDALNTDLATPWADALLAGFSITRKEPKQ